MASCRCTTIARAEHTAGYDRRADFPLTAGMQTYPAGSLILEAGPEPHWWENRGHEPVRLYAVDIYDRAARE